jgi:uncharacterized FlgJ-related protein
MHETGIPASIVLGVAMHESGCGNSTIAQNLNNQFGSKGRQQTLFYTKHKKKYALPIKDTIRYWILSRILPVS